MNSRNQYLKSLQGEYLKASRKEKMILLDEAVKRSGLNRKHLIVKLSAKTSFKPKAKQLRKQRKSYYDGEIVSALVKCWRIFDNPCGQRLKPILKTEIDRLRSFGELNISDEAADKLKRIGSSTIDEKLARQKETELLRRKYHKKNHPLLYHKIPTKTAGEFGRDLIGQVQIDFVEHCGSSAAGEYIHTLSVTDIVSGWWEGEAVMGKGQQRTFGALTDTRLRFPFVWTEIHPDNDTAFINWHLYNYAQKEELFFSRSRPLKKNDNCYVEQKNSTHVRSIVGYLRHDTNREQRIINDLYRNELRLYKNFFQPVMRLKQKERCKGKIKRKYHEAKTPYQYLLESKHTSKATKEELKEIYNNLNPAELKRNIDFKLRLLYQAYQIKKNKNEDKNINIVRVDPTKKLRPSLVRFLNHSTTPATVR